jgi:hypothetical protein
MKKRTETAAALGVFFLFCLISAPPVFPAGKITDYTADQVSLDASGKVRHQGKIYASGEKMRMEGMMRESGADLVMIFRGDLKKSFMLNPAKKTYFERPADPNEMPGDVMQMVKNRSEKELGREKVGGYECTKKQIDSEVEIMGMTRKTRSIVWQSPQFDMPLRTRGESGETTEMRNVREGKPDAALFEVPAGYQPVSGIMELMGMPAPSGMPPGMKLPVPKQ